MNTLPYKGVLLLLGVAALAAGAQYFSGSRITSLADPFEDLTVSALGEERTYFKDRIEAIGTKAAYEEFKRENEGMTYTRQHALAHLFGELVYEKEGIGGVAVCDGAFGFGCFHSFFGKAIQDRGVSIVKELDEACIQTYGPRGTGCSHGLGHGVLAYTGEEDLLHALEICNTLAFKGPIGGCSSGVFMEYNFRTMQGEENNSRPLDVSLKNEPCSTLPIFRVSCFFEQAAWWRSSLDQTGLSDRELYTTLGAWCSEIAGRLEQDACLRGIGNIIPAKADFDVDLSIRHCSFMPDRDAELACRKGAAWGFFTDPARREQAIYLCTLGTKETEKNTCLSEYQII